MMQSKRFEPIKTIIVILIFLMVLGGGSVIVSAESIVPSTAIQMIIQGQEIWFDPNNMNYTTTIPITTCEFPMEFQAGNYEGWDIIIDGNSLQSGKTTFIQLERLSKDEPLEVNMTNQLTGETVTQYIATLPDTVQDYTVISQVDDGVYYFTENNYAIKMNHKGEIIFCYAVLGASNFKRVEFNEDVYYTLSATNLVHQYPPLASGVGPSAKAIVLDAHYNIVKEIPYLYETERTPAGIPMDMHEFTMLGEEHFIWVGVVGERVTNIPDYVSHSKFGARVAAAVIQEIRDDQVVFEWYSTDYPELYAQAVDLYHDYFNENAEFCDYAHINSVTVDPSDNNLVCSFRNLCCILKIDRETGGILWTLGGKGDDFGLPDEWKPYHQHHAIPFGDGFITVFDNGNDKQQSRIVEYRLDEDNKTVLSFSEYYLENQFSFFAGGAQRLPGDTPRYVIGWGGMKGTNAMVSDIDFGTNTVLFEVVRMVTNGVDYVYRAFRYDQ